MNGKTWIASLATLTALTVGCIAMTQAGEHATDDDDISLEDLPAPVQQTILKAAASNAVYGFAREDEGGKTVYEARFAVDHVEHTISVSDTGALLEEEIAMDVKALPAAVVEAIARRYGTAATIKEAETVKAAEQSFIDVEVLAGKEKHEIRFDAAGKMVWDVVERDHSDRKAQRDREDDGKDHGKKGKHRDDDDDRDGHDNGGDKDNRQDKD